MFCTQPADKAVFTNASGHIELPDNAEIQLGDKSGGDLRLRHNGSASQIQGFTGQLQITNFEDDSDVRILTDDGSGGATDYFRADGSTGDAILYHYGTEKLKTQSGGVDVTGTVTADGLTLGASDKIVFGSDITGVYRNTSGNDLSLLHWGNVGILIDSDNNDSSRQFVVGRNSKDASTADIMLKIAESGDISFYEDTGTTAKLTWDASAEELQFKDSVKAEFGDGGDLQIYANSGFSYIDETGSGNLNLRTNGANIGIYDTANSQYMARFTTGGDAELYYNGSEKLATTSTGVDVTGNITVSGTVDGRDLATDGTKLDGIETSADVTDSTNVSAAGALMKTGGTMTGALDFGSVTGRVITITGDSGLDHSDASIYLGNATSNYGFDIEYEGSGSGNTNAFVITSTNQGSPKEVLRANQDGIARFPNGTVVTGNITVSGTVDGRDIATDGTKLDGIASSATANPNAIDNVVEDTTPQLGGNLDLNSNNITGTGNINITGTLQTSSNAIIGGDLTVSGTTTTVNTETINLADNNIVLNSNLSSSTLPTENGGITINRGSQTDKVFQWDEGSDYWEIDDDFHAEGIEELTQLQIQHIQTLNTMELSLIGLARMCVQTLMEQKIYISV